MSFKEKVQKELDGFKAWAEEANMQAHLAKSEVSAELRGKWMEAEQSMAKLEAKLGDLSDDADEASARLVETLKRKRDELKKALDDA